MNATKKTMAVVLGSAFVASVAATSVNAAENPFAIKSLSSGYMVAEKGAEGKCGTGKCGAEKGAEGKCGEGKCSADKKAEGACGADKAKEGACNADKAKEGSCSAAE